MKLLHLPNWPLLLVCLGMIACAVVDWWKFKVPNYLTFPLILGGWLLGLVHTLGFHPDNGSGGFLASVGGTFWGFALLFPMLAIGGVGTGDVKMQMGFGAWIGAFFGYDGHCFWIIFVAFCAGAIAGGIISFFMMLVQGDYGKYLDHVRVIVTDFYTQGSISKIAERAHDRRPKWYKLPYGIPLCIGFVGVLIFLASQGPQSPAAEDAPQNSVAAAERCLACAERGESLP